MPVGWTASTVETGLTDPQSSRTSPERTRRTHRRSAFQACLLAGDLAGILLAFWLVLSYVGQPQPATATYLWLPFALLAFCLVLVLFMRRHYSLRPARVWLVQGSLLASSTIGGILLAVAVTALIDPRLVLPRSIYLAVGALSWLGFLLVRLLAMRFGPETLVRERLLIVGTGPRAQSLIRALTDGHNPNEARLVGVLTVPGEPEPPEPLPCPVLGTLAECAEIVGHHDINHVVITPALPLTGDLIQAGLRSDALGARVQTMETAYEELTLRAPVFHVGEAWIASFDNLSSTKYASRFKRLADVTLTVLLLPLALLCLGACALLVKLTSKGPVFYHQERIGKDGVPFTITKLRTMVVDAEKLTGPVWAGKNDPRITPVGRLLRKSHLDEMPQIFSVLTGDMSLIGPRPERPNFVEKLKQEIPLYDKRHVVPPGLTGWRQVNHYYDNTTEDSIESLRYDLYYIRHMSFSLDLLVIFRTFSVIFGMKGQ